jgi:ATP/maltotriose-dependent transcriptional regulator MalT
MAARTRALHAAGRVAQYAGAFERAAQLFEVNLQLASETDDRHERGRALAGLGDVAAHRADYAHAEMRHREALAIFRELGDASSLAESLTQLSQIVAERNNLQEATALADEAVVLYRGLGDNWGIAYALGTRGELSRRIGDRESARAQFEEALVLRRAVGTKVGVRASLLNLTLVALEMADVTTAARTCRECIDVCGDLADRSGAMARCLEVAAGVAAARGAGAESARLLGAADALRAIVGTPMSGYEWIEHQRWVAAALALVGSVKYAALWQGGRLLSMEHALQLASAGTQGPAETLSRAHSSAVVDGSPQWPAGLSPREIDVLQLVATGLSNAKVAKQLDVSPRTVAQHLQSIYNKLSVASRTAAARFWFDHAPN